MGYGLDDFFNDWSNENAEYEAKRARHRDHLRSAIQSGDPDYYRAVVRGGGPLHDHSGSIAKLAMSMLLGNFGNNDD